MQGGNAFGSRSNESYGEGCVMARREETAVPVLLDVNEVARRLGTKPRFVRRLIAERRIEFHKLGRYVRISEPALAEFIKAGRVESMSMAGVRPRITRMRGAA